MPARLAPPASIAAPPAPWASWTDALMAGVLELLLRHDRLPIPGCAVRRPGLVEPALRELLSALRRQG